MGRNPLPSSLHQPPQSDNHVTILTLPPSTCHKQSYEFVTICHNQSDQSCDQPQQNVLIFQVKKKTWQRI